MSTSVHYHEEESEESYFVSMTDIMVGMLFVFIILLMFFVFQIQNVTTNTVPEEWYNKAQADLRISRAQVVELQKEVKELEAEVKRLKQNTLERYLAAADRDRTQILDDIKQSLSEAGISVQVIPDQGILRLPEEILFASGKSAITPEAQNAAKVLAAALAKTLPCFSLGPAGNPRKSCNPNASFIDAIFIEGHTDNKPVRNEIEPGVFDNLGLSASRATNTLRAIETFEPELTQLYSISPSKEGQELGKGNSKLMNAAAFGDSRPAYSNDNTEGQSMNRRIDLRLLMYSPHTEKLDAIRELLKP